MAHIVKIEHMCPGACGKRGAFQVFNSQNASMGVFCKRHAELLLKDLKRRGA